MSQKPLMDFYKFIRKSPDGCKTIFLFQIGTKTMIIYIITLISLLIVIFTYLDAESIKALATSMLQKLK